MNFKRIELSNKKDVEELSALASSIVQEHYDPILGKEQNNYMIEMFQSVHAIEEQLEGGYNYYIVLEEDEEAGFIGFYPKDDKMYLSKFYLKKECRGKGYSIKMLDFIKSAAREKGLGKVFLNVNKYNDALTPYEHLGFYKIREEKNDIGNGYFMDDYVLECLV